MSSTKANPQHLHIISQATKPLALVFTDMVGSNAAKRSEQLGQDVSERDRAFLEGIQTKHLHMIREAIAEYHGSEIMTIGDSFFLTFEDIADAVRCSAAIQQRLRAFPIDTPNGPLQLRIGIHIGTPEYFENSWHGTDVDTAARAESAGSPCQIVVTDKAREVAGHMAGIEFRPMGTFQLKGVGAVKLWDADYDQHGPRKPSLVSIETGRRRKMIATAVTGTLLVVAAILGGWRLWQYYQVTKASKALSLAKDSIILADFENKTGDPVFDTTLTQAFAIQMEQSPVLKLVNQQHIRQSMQYLGKSQDDPVTPAIAREIGEREGVKAYLIGSIAKLGNSYLITVTAQNLRTGDDIAVAQAETSDKDHVLDAMGKVATAMRARLGESLSSIEKLDTPLEQATTPSLEAFRAYALGDVEHAKGLDVPEAEGHYRQAIEIDPNFAMAWARLGVVYLNSGQSGKAFYAFAKAHELSKNVSEREQLYIQGQYNWNVTGNLEKAREALELAVKTYPMDMNATVNLGVVNSALGNLDEASVTFRRALDIMPDDAIALLDYMQVFFQQDRMDETAKVMSEIHQRQLDKSDSMLSAAYPIFYVNGNTQAIEDAKRQVQGRPYESYFNMSVAEVAEFAGQYHLAEATWRKAAEEAVVIRSPDAEASRLLWMVTGRALAGMTEGGAQTVKTALALDKSKPTLVQAVFAAALVNDRADALPLIAKLDKDYPEDTIIQQVVLPESRAALALAAHDPAGALRELEPAKAYYLVAPEAYLEGQAYLEIRDGASAVEAFQRATKYRGNAMLIPMQDYGQGLLGLARAYTMTGNKAAAKKAYEDLLAVWKNADQDLAMLQTAKKEYAALQ